MYKTKQFILCILIMGLFTSSCSKENIYLSFNEFQTFSISETLTTDNYDERINKTESFSFTDGKLQSGKVTQVIPHFNHTTECPSNISYALDVTVMGCVVEKATYTLNSDGYAVSCVLEESGLSRHYQFTYTNGYLSSIYEEINGDESFSMELSYEKGNLIKTKEHIHNNEYVCKFVSTPEKNVGKLPLHYLTELYPLYFHNMAMYAGILGKAPNHLIQQITVEHNTTDSVSYTYQFSNEYITSCNIKITNNVATSFRSLHFNYE